jgi:hypothetical protein
VLDKVASLGKTEGFRHEVDAVQQQRKVGYEEFRSVATSRVTFFDRLIAAESAASQPANTAAER